MGHYEQALHAFRRLEQPVLIAAALTNLGELQRIRGHLEGSSDLLRQALVLQQELGAQSAEAYALTQLGATLRRQGRFGASADHFEQALRLQLTLGEVGSSGLTFLEQARLEIDRQNYGLALDLARRAAVDLRQAGSEDSAVLAQLVEVDILLTRPDPDLERARELIDLALLHAAATQSAEVVLRAQLAEARLGWVSSGDAAGLTAVKQAAEEAGFVWIAEGVQVSQGFL